MALPRGERLALAVELLESIEPEDDGVEHAWDSEIGCRIEHMDRGETQMLSNAEALARIGRVLRS